MIITESTRKELIDISRRSDTENDGETRLNKTFKVKISKSTKGFNEIDMNKFFNEGELSVNLDVLGETDTYEVTIAFGGILKNLQDSIRRTNSEEVSLEMIDRALMKAFDHEDLDVRCTCEDFNYREAYWTGQDDSLAPPPQPEFPDETNPNNTTGLTCKHVNVALTMTTWLLSCGMVIYNYINYMKKNYPDLYQNIIYPALYERDYTAPQEEIPEENPEPEFDVNKDYGPPEIDAEESEPQEQEQEYNIDKKEEPEKRFDFDSEISDY